MTTSARSLEIGAGVAGAGLLMWWLWRRHVRAELPGSVEPDEGGKDEAPPGSVDAEDEQK